MKGWLFTSSPPALNFPPSPKKCKATVTNRAIFQRGKEQEKEAEEEAPKGPHFVKVFGDKKGEEGAVNCPCGLAVDKDGNLLVSEFNNSRISVFTPDGDFLRAYGSLGDGQLKHPWGVACDHDNGQIVVSDVDNSRVVVFGPDGGFVRAFGSKGSGDGEFNKPQGLAVDRQGNIIVADSFNKRVQVFTSGGVFVKAIPNR